MKKQLIALLFAVLPVSVFAAESGYPLDHFEADVANQASLQDGLKTYQSFCAGCHATGFQRYERVADDLGIPHDLFRENIIFNGAKIGSLMDNAMREEEAKRWFGAAPPDLTLVARVRGGDWLYTYLRTFYVDPKRPWGVNNKVFPDVGMPHVLAELQGLQVDNCAGADSGERDNLTGDKLCGFDLVEKGSMTPAEYDQAVFNLVNYLVYAAEPMQLERQRIGMWVLLFLLVLLVPAYLLKKEYWKDVH
ncbi:cytochrome c1 [Aestuariirhabdus sp. LZHN29]|uniref:cytochrome c1 n=1 Tax=Aestuariirhabdus sp. LZHN29 TaxID=3417462 RepID=UPI003CE94274